MATQGARTIQQKMPPTQSDGALRQALTDLENLLVSGDAQAALVTLPDLLAGHPHSPDLYHLLGIALAALGQVDDALAAYAVAHQLAPGRADILSNRAVAFKQAGRLGQALEALDEAVARAPDFADALYNRANILKDLRRLDEAVSGYDRVLALQPGYAEAWNNRSVAMFERGDMEEALRCAGRAVELAPGDANAHYNRGLALRKSGHLVDAVAAYRAALAVQPDYTRAHVGKLFLEACMCHWEERDAGLASGPTGLSGLAIDPFPLLALEDRPDHHHLRAQRWTRSNWGKVARAHIAPRMTREKLKIGYFSADFHDHATMQLMARLFALHDRTRFEIHGFSFGPPSTDKFRREAVTAMDCFHDIRALDDSSAAAFARAQGIDVAVDLKGHTQGARTGIFAHGAAPVQVAYLGYPGTTGAAFMDFLIADEKVIPPTARQHYSERIVFLPNSYLATDNTRPVDPVSGGRAGHGLPEQGFVFCSFNNTHKISSAEFDCWMRLLATVEGSVLWLLRDNEAAVTNLRREASRRGISPHRLVFADRVTSREHLARHVLADLCLDSFNYNAHTTAVDCLWAGVPILTAPGVGFASRVAASLLQSLDMPELIATDRVDYERRALSLARSPEVLGELKTRLQANGRTSALFDTERLTRDLEAAYLAMHDDVQTKGVGDLYIGH